MKTMIEKWLLRMKAFLVHQNANHPELKGYPPAETEPPKPNSDRIDRDTAS